MRGTKNGKGMPGDTEDIGNSQPILAKDLVQHLVLYIGVITDIHAIGRLERSHLPMALPLSSFECSFGLLL